jgi:hypothetical protein
MEVIQMDISYKRDGDKVLLTASQTMLHRQPNTKSLYKPGRIKKEIIVIHSHLFPDFESAILYGNQLFTRGI